MRIVIALGGNALLQRGEPMLYEKELSSVRKACQAIASIADHHELIVTHGNGPQVGLIALQQLALGNPPAYPLDTMGAQSIGLIGYLITRELKHFLPARRAVTAVLTQTEVDPNDPAFRSPSKPIGPVYEKTQAQALARLYGWHIAADNDKFRRVVASPEPKQIVDREAIEILLQKGHIVVCCGGGGIPVIKNSFGHLTGVEAVIDKDLASSLLACELKADCFIIATDVQGIFTDWDSGKQNLLHKTTPQSLRSMHFQAGSMGPKVQAVCRFVEKTGQKALIGSLDRLSDMLKGQSGTEIIPRND